MIYIHLLSDNDNNIQGQKDIDERKKKGKIMVNNGFNIYIIFL